MKLGKMLSVGEVVEGSGADEPAAATEQPAPATAPVIEREESKPAPAPVFVSAGQ